MVDMANAALAGGVAIGSVCDVAAPAVAFGIGLLAGTVSVLGYVFLQPVLESKFKLVDTCGVHNLHGMPGLLGGLSAFLVVPGIAVAQFNGIMITLFIAVVGGLVAGFIVKATGTTREPYEDSVEFTHLAGPETENLSEQLQTRVEALETRATAVKPQLPVESPETKALIARLESRVMMLEAKTAAQATSPAGEEPQT